MIVHITSRHLDKEVELFFEHYRDDTTAITAISLQGEPEFVATVSIPNEKPREGCVFLKGWSENEGIPEALAKAGVVRLTGRKVKAGFCEAIEAEVLVTPVWRRMTHKQFQQ